MPHTTTILFVGVGIRDDRVWRNAGIGRAQAEAASKLERRRFRGSVKREFDNLLTRRVQRIKMRTKLMCVAAAAMAFASQAYCGAADGQQGKRPFTLTDDIGFTHFVSGDDAYGGEYLGDSGILFSPDG